MFRPSRITRIAGEDGRAVAGIRGGRVMLPVTTMPMPGALRLRALHPLIEGDGSCSSDL